MDMSSIVQNLNTDFSSKITDAMKKSSQLTNNSSGDGTFDTAFNSALGLLNQTNSYIQDAQQAEVDFALGKISNTHELSVIQQKANVALQYTVAIRDKALDAYREIMNMQI